MRNLRQFSFVVVVVVATFSFLLPCFANTLKKPSSKQLKEKLSKVQVPFVENRTQYPEQVKYSGNLLNGKVFVTEDNLTYLLETDNPGEKIKHKRLQKNKSQVKGKSKANSRRNKTTVVFHEQFLTNTGKSITLKPSGIKKSITRVNYFIGKDKSHWQSNLPTYRSISLGDVYPKIEVKLYLKGGSVEKVFEVSPGGKVEDIVINVDGVEKIKVGKDGRLILKKGKGEVYQSNVIAYQEIKGKRSYVDAGYRIIGNNRYGFRAGNYDPTRPLIIDPILDTLSSATYLGGSGREEGNSVAIDSNGNVFVTGTTWSNDFPTTTDGYDTTLNGGDYDVFVAKFSNDLSQLLSATYLGGSDWDEGNSVAIDSNGNVFVTGDTYSNDFPAPGGYDTTFNGEYDDVFVAKFSNNLSQLLSATYLGGYDWVHSVAIDSNGNVFVTGETTSNDFPATPDGYDTTLNGYDDVFVAKFSNNLSQLLSATYLGGSHCGEEGYGSDYEWGHSVAIDSNGNVFVAGDTQSDDFPTTTGRYDTTFNGGIDVFVAKFNNNLSQLLSATYLGGSTEDYGHSVAIDSNGNVFVTGRTASHDFPTPGGYDTTYNYNPVEDAFVAKFSNNLSQLLSATYLGGNGGEEGHSVAIDSNGNVFVTGDTNSTDFPTPDGYDTTFNGRGDAFVAKFSNNLSQLLSATYLGGSDGDYGNSLAIDSNGNVFVTGYTTSDDFPAPGGYDTTYNGGNEDAFVARFGEVNNPPGNAGYPSSPLPALSLDTAVDPTHNTVTVPPGEIIIHPSMSIPAEDQEKQAQLLMYIYLPEYGGIPLLYGPTVTLSNIVTFDSFFQDPLDLSDYPGLVAYIYCGYLLPDGGIKYNAYELNITQ